MFVSINRSADLGLTPPSLFCCNCGSRDSLNLAHTPLRKSSYFLFFGSETTLNGHFPYCPRCRATAQRVRQNWTSKILLSCMVAAVLFLAFISLADSLPKILSGNLFYSSVVIGFALTLGYFHWRERSAERSYYQPVWLDRVDIADDQMVGVKLRFHNKNYARVFANCHDPCGSPWMMEDTGGVRASAGRGRSIL